MSACNQNDVLRLSLLDGRTPARNVVEPGHVPLKGGMEHTSLLAEKAMFAGVRPRANLQGIING